MDLRSVIPAWLGRLVGTALVGATAAILLTSPLALAGGQASLADTRQATARFQDLDAALAAGYGRFYICTDQPGQGAMGQHFANGALVGDPAVDALRPEVLVYEPLSGGGYRLVAVEYVTFQEAWDATHATPPELFGETFHAVGAGNRYGLPPFYALHAWIWQPNPSGMFAEWNPSVSCSNAFE